MAQTTYTSQASTPGGVDLSGGRGRRSPRWHRDGGRDQRRHDRHRRRRQRRLSNRARRGRSQIERSPRGSSRCCTATDTARSI
jgi:hypothetical protein